LRAPLSASASRTSSIETMRIPLVQPY